MKHIVFIAKYFCEICNEEIASNVYADFETTISNEDKAGMIEWAKHFHWVDKHRLCAICGKFVTNKDLELAINDGKIIIHKDYTDEYATVKRGDRFNSLLIVHTNCIKDQP